MAESDNGAAVAPPPADGQNPAQAGGAPGIAINAQYIKDLSFENPRAPHSLLQQQQQPEVQVGVDVKAQNLAPNLYEVLLTVHAEAKSGADRIFLVELVYGAVCTLTNVPEAAMAGVLLVEAPRLIFPFARAVVAHATREGGFMPLMLRPIDFGELLRQQQARTAGGQPTLTA